MASNPLDEYVTRYNGMVAPYTNCINSQVMLLVTETVLSSASRDMNAAFEGSMGSGHREMQNLISFLDGIYFDKTGRSCLYGEYFERQKLKEDPDYAKFVELRKKFHNL